MDNHGQTTDNSENQNPVKVEKGIKLSTNSILSSIQFGHPRTVRDKNT
jgi:hypothetical protein